MENRNVFRFGIVGTAITALCCLIPVLVNLGGVGLSALVGHFDYVLLPALAFFFGLTLYAV